MNSEEQFTEDIRVRVPKEIREAFQRLKRRRLKKESELVREALLDYLAKNGESITDTAGEPIDTTHQQLSERISAKEGEPDRVAKEAAAHAIGEITGEPPAETSGDDARRKIADEVKRASSGKSGRRGNSGK